MNPNTLTKIELDWLLDSLGLEMADLEDAQLAVKVCRKSVKWHRNRIRTLRARINRAIASQEAAGGAFLQSPRAS